MGSFPDTDIDPFSLYVSFGTDKENSFNNQGLLFLHSHVLNPLYHNVSMHILHTVLYTFPKVLTRRIWLAM